MEFLNVLLQAGGDTSGFVSILNQYLKIILSVAVGLGIVSAGFVGIFQNDWKKAIIIGVGAVLAVILVGALISFLMAKINGMSFITA